MKRVGGIIILTCDYNLQVWYGHRNTFLVILVLLNFALYFLFPPISTLILNIIVLTNI
jgi:hypothetical protein